MPTEREMAEGYITQRRAELESFHQQVNELNQRIAQHQAHIAECEAALNPPAPAKTTRNRK